MFLLHGSFFQVWWAPVSVLVSNKPKNNPGQEQAVSLSCLWAPCNIISFHLFLSPVTWITVGSCLVLMSFVWKWTVWWNTNVFFCIDQEISVLQTELSSPRTEISRWIEWWIFSLLTGSSSHVNNAMVWKKIHLKIKGFRRVKVCASY